MLLLSYSPYHHNVLIFSLIQHLGWVKFTRDNWRHSSKANGCQLKRTNGRKTLHTCYVQSWISLALKRNFTIRDFNWNRSAFGSKSFLVLATRVSFSIVQSVKQSWKIAVPLQCGLAAMSTVRNCMLTVLNFAHSGFFSVIVKYLADNHAA